MGADLVGEEEGNERPSRIIQLYNTCQLNGIAIEHLSTADTKHEQRRGDVSQLG